MLNPSVPLPTDALTAAVAFISALSVASERVVAVAKTIFPWLRDEKPPAPSIRDVGAEEARSLAVMAISYFSSLGICYFFLGGWFVDLGGAKPHPVHAAVLAFLALGGSAFWAQVVGVLSAIKEVKQNEANLTAPRLRRLP